MFGYLTASLDTLSEEEKTRYNACYCGLCRSLRERHGLFAGMSLNFDMTFLVLLVNSLYEPEESSGEDRCPAHPFSKRAWVRREAADYAADMNIALAYHKCMDDWTDDKNVVALSEAKLIKKEYEEVCRSYPRQCEAMKKSIAELRELEINDKEDPDAAADTFGDLMAEVLVYREDRWSDTVRGMGRALGRFIYVMDACLDLSGDVKHGRYNPFKNLYDVPDSEEYFRDILKMTLGECIMYFDRLPLVQDVGIMQNILCAGLWAQYSRKYSEKKKGPSDDTGSV